MAVADQQLTCRDCGKAFTFSAGEQEFFEQKGYTNLPTRCQVCRVIMRPPAPPQRPVRPARPERETFVVACASCGNDAVVPFKPTQGRPVLCNTCFRSQR